MSGEASDHFLMGYIRFAHFAAGYVFAIGLAGRVYWAFVGNHHAREMVTLPVLRLAYWREVWAMFTWYLFLRPRPNQYVGHNPLARLMMFVGYFLLSLFMLATGFALYGEGLQAGSRADRMFGWLIPLLGQSQGVHTWHHLGMWAMVIFVIAHIYAAVRGTSWAARASSAPWSPATEPSGLIAAMPGTACRHAPGATCLPHPAGVPCAAHPIRAVSGAAFSASALPESDRSGASAGRVAAQAQ